MVDRGKVILIRKTNILTVETLLEMMNVNTRKRETREGTKVSLNLFKEIVNGRFLKTSKYLHENDMLNEDNLLDDTKI